MPSFLLNVFAELMLHSCCAFQQICLEHLGKVVQEEEERGCIGFMESALHVRRVKLISTEMLKCTDSEIILFDR